MREELVRAITAGAHPQYTPEQLWAAQFRQQQPPPPPLNNQILRAPLPEAMNDPNTTAPMRVTPVPDERFTRFPLQGEPRPGEDEGPFPGVVAGGGTVENVGPYSLPKSPPKKAEKKKGKG